MAWAGLAPPWVAPWALFRFIRRWYSRLCVKSTERKTRGASQPFGVGVVAPERSSIVGVVVGMGVARPVASMRAASAEMVGLGVVACAALAGNPHPAYRLLSIANDRWFPAISPYPKPVFQK